MRTTDEIMARCKASDSAFGFEREVLAEYVPFENLMAAGVLKPDANPEGWTWKEPTRETLIKDMADYMTFAWGKAADHRGLSAGRSIDKMRAWLWLLEDVDLSVFAADPDNYPQYGAPVLAAICRKYGFPIPDDPGVLRMIEGRPCCSHCREGCGA